MSGMLARLTMQRNYLKAQDRNGQHGDNSSFGDPVQTQNITIDDDIYTSDNNEREGYFERNAIEVKDA